MPKKGFDFSGYATKNNVRCTDGTVIRQGCFHEMNGKTVPLVWQHQHNSVGEVLGHAELEERPDGMYCYAYCNDTPSGQNAKELVKHGDINAFSIWANNIKRNANDILHGTIREVSLVLAGADRTAIIDNIVEHGEESDDQAEIAFLGGYGDMKYSDYVSHADKDEEDIDQNEELDDEQDEEEDSNSKKKNDRTVQDVLDTFNKEQRAVLNYIVGKAIQDTKNGGADDEDEDEDEDDEVQHADDDEDAEDFVEDHYDDDEDGDGQTVEDVLKTFTPEQRDVMNYIVGLALEEQENGSADEDEDEDSDEEEDDVKHNAFEDYNDEGYASDYISHDDMVELTKDAKALGGSLREAYYAAEDNGTIAHAADQTAGVDYGIGNVDYLFPEARAINNQPDFISRNMDWVDGVLSGVHKTPFSRVKSIHANITEDEARARGYIKGKLKKEEVFSLLKRATYPQTIYKKQRLDKDDIDDITDFDVIVWLKGEMQVMLREEIARAILIGDGRLASEDDKIKEENIRPVYNDSDLYTIKYAVEVPENATDDEKAKALMKAQLKARKLYKGSGNLTFYTKEDELTNMLLLENGIGERLYKSEAEIATAMRVTKVVPVPVMENLQIEITGEDGNSKTKYEVAGVDVNLADYNVGTNGGAKTDFFDDFDLDYNQQIVLYETRLSGAMIKPYGAITFYYKPVAGKTASVQD